MNRERITMLGTGEAVTTHCYNTCFTLHTQDTTLLVDGGGGNGISQRCSRHLSAVTSLPDTCHSDMMATF